MGGLIGATDGKNERTLWGSSVRLGLVSALGRWLVPWFDTYLSLSLYKILSALLNVTRRDKKVTMNSKRIKKDE